MAYPHAIRLRGPWQVEACASPIAVQPEPGFSIAVSAEVPGDWGTTLGSRFFGRARYRRNFQWPQPLASHERLWLVCEGADARGSLALNGVPLGAVRGYALASSFDVTPIAQRRNELLLEVELPPGEAGGAALLRPGREQLPGGPLGQVRLEVRAEHSLDWISLHALASNEAPTTLTLSGQVTGPADDDLAITLVANERELLHANVNPAVAFQLSARCEGLPTWSSGSARELADLEIRLSTRASCIWTQTIRTAATELCWNAVNHELRVGSDPVQWPLSWLEDLLPVSVVASRQASLVPWSKFNQAPLAVAQIWPEEFYCRCDRARMTVLQSLPLAWAEEVGGRLAHHPSIAGWLLAEADLSAARSQSLAPLLHGRPWVERERVCVLFPSRARD